MADSNQIGEVVDAWADLGPTRRLPSFAPPPLPSAKTMEIVGKLGLRYPPANSVDREAHAARVALLAEDCADIEPEWLDAAARQWAKTQPFFPRACELRDEALAYGRLTTQGRALPAPSLKTAPPPPPAPPLTEAEIRKLPPHLVKLGVKLGEIPQELADRLRDEAA